MYADLPRAGNKNGRQQARHRPKKVYKMLLLSGILSFRRYGGAQTDRGKDLDKVNNNREIEFFLKELCLP
jgi:hypothetical protein